MVNVILQRLLRRFVRAVIQKRGVLLAVVLVGLLAGGGIAGYRALTGHGRPMALPLPGTGAEPPATERFLRGNQTFDAEMVWEAYSETAQARFASRGGSLAEIRRQLEAARQSGTRIEGFDYIGGRQLQGGGSIEFYLVTVVSGQTQGQREFVPYVFTLDASGKIDRVQ